MTKQKITSTLARTDDGTLTVTFSIPDAVIDEHEKEALTKMAEGTVVPGFRKGKAPLEKVKEKIDPEKLLEKILTKILPKAFSGAISEHKITPIMYPRFQIISQKSPWQVAATTCELPAFDLSGYKEALKKAISDPKKLSSEEKEKEILTALPQVIQFSVPKVLVEEEVNLRLSQLISKIEKLGLTLENYLSSMGKSAIELRKSYEEEVERSLKIELILNKVSDSEKIKVEEKEIDSAVAAAAADPTLKEKLNSSQERQIIGSIIKRRRALDLILSSL